MFSAQSDQKLRGVVATRKESILIEASDRATVLLKDRDTDPSSAIAITHACLSHKDDGPFSTLETHRFSVTIDIPGLHLTVGPFYWHLAFIALLLTDLEAFAKFESEGIAWRLYPDDMEKAIGFFRVQGKYAYRGHEMIDWKVELDGPGLDRAWTLSFGFITSAKQLKHLKSDLKMMLIELNDPLYESRSTNKIEPYETALSGTWALIGGEMINDDVGLRIRSLITSHLVRLASDDSGWNTLYRDPDDGRFWELTHPRGEMQAGGPQRLSFITAYDVKRKYGM